VAGDLVGMVLAAGLGTRLRPLTERLPKPAVPVCGLPLVQFALARMAAAGARRAVVNTHHLAPEMERAARGAARAVGLELEVSHEPEIAGTGGALREAARSLEGADAIALWNGDVLFALDLRPVVEGHLASGALATMVLAPMPAGASYAAVEVDAVGCVRRIAGHGPGGPGLRSLHFTGVHVLSPALLESVPSRPFACDVNRHVYPPLLAAGRVRGVVAGGWWDDLGTPERYLRANLDLLAGGAALPPLAGADPLAGLSPAGPAGAWIAPGALLDPGVTMEGPVLIGRGARVGAGARLGPGAVLGEGVRVGRGATVRRAVVWDATEIAPGETVEDAVAAGPLRVGAAPGRPGLSSPGPGPAPR
jgi:mannose-1-phosphate guanylyltransferase